MKPRRADDSRERAGSKSGATVGREAGEQESFTPFERMFIESFNRGKETGSCAKSGDDRRLRVRGEGLPCRSSRS
jgi:hypothetical protein